MKTQRERLELAAKAAGYQIDQRSSFFTWKDGRRLALLNPSGGHTLWNSEEDDGDALRLANKLRINIQRETLTSAPFPASVNCGQYGAGRPEWAEEPEGNDPSAATRLAITRAAAAIGEAMP